MEPRSFKRGNNGLSGTEFNPTLCFNGATFIQTWKPACAWRFLHCVISASMEPRSFKRGNIAAETERINQEASFNGATFIQTWKRSRCCLAARKSAMLQWSHVHSNVETVWSMEEAEVFLKASMEPRSFKRGNVSVSSGTKSHSACFNGATFIQTWKHRRKSCMFAHTLTALQWSHVHSNVETFALEQGVAGNHRLQWSHVHSNVETIRFERCRFHV